MPARTDNNHTEIVAALRAVGAAVQSLAGVGEGCPDLLVAHNRQWYIIEVKNGAKPPAHRKLTAAEQAWHDKFAQHAPVYTVLNVEQALAVIQPKYFIPDSVLEVFGPASETGGFLSLDGMFQTTIAGNPSLGWVD